MEPTTLKNETRSVDPLAGSQQPPARKRIVSDLMRVVTVGAFFLAALYVLHLPVVRERLFDISLIRADLDAMGRWGWLGFILAAGLLTSFGIPRLAICVVAGSLFGAVQGVALAMAGTLLGAISNFLVARWVLRGVVRRHMPARLRPWYDGFNRYGFQWLLMIRFFPISNATVTNVLGGVSRMPFSHFLAATVIGYMPESIVFALFGSSAAKQNALQFILGLVLFGLVLATYEVMRRRARILEAEIDNAP